MSSEASIRCSTSGAPVSKEPPADTSRARIHRQRRSAAQTPACGSGWRAPALIALVLLLAAGIGYWWDQNRLDTAVDAPRALPAQARQTGRGGATAQTPKHIPRPLPPRRPLDIPEPDRFNRWLVDRTGAVIAVIPMLLCLPWLALTWIGYGQVLRRRRVRGTRPLHRITLDAGQDDLFDTPRLREALRRLHRSVPLPTRWLDAEASARRTARNGGLFEPVLRRRRRVPELVALVEHTGAAAQMLDRLVESGLTVTRYQYRGDPRSLVGANGRRIGLSELARRHPGARLLVIGDLAGFVEPFGG